MPAEFWHLLNIIAVAYLAIFIGIIFFSLFVLPPKRLGFSRPRRFKNGWGVSLVQNCFSRGLEAALFKWRERKPSRTERIADRFRVILGKSIDEKWEGKLVFEDVLGHKKFQDGVFPHLDPDERNEILALTEALKSWEEW